MSVQNLKHAPSFYILKAQSPRPGAVVFGGVVSLVVLGALSIGISQLKSYVGRETVAFGRQAPTASAADSDEAPSSDLRSSLSSPDQSIYLHDQLSRRNRNAAAPAIPDFDEDAKLDAASRKLVIARITAILKEYYVYPDVAQKMADALVAHEEHGENNTVTDGQGFAELLTKQMRAVSHDRHLAVEYSRRKTVEHPSGPTAEALARYRADMKRTNCTFEKVQLLSRNIGYLKFNEFPMRSVCQSTVLTVMGRLRHVDAIIFDLRDNHGGDPNMVAFIATYLFDHPTHLNDIYNRKENSTREYWTLPPVPANKLADKPAYVLTSSSTFSGAEEFSYDLKMLKRATLIGETTAGAAHLGSSERVDDHFTLRVPVGRAINPISKKDWEGTGVEPDIKVNAADALATAQRLAGKRAQK